MVKSVSRKILVLYTGTWTIVIYVFHHETKIFIKNKNNFVWWAIKLFDGDRMGEKWNWIKINLYQCCKKNQLIVKKYQQWICTYVCFIFRLIYNICHIWPLKVKGYNFIDQRLLSNKRNCPVVIYWVIQ
jgi:hypothetical protein